MLIALIWKKKTKNKKQPSLHDGHPAKISFWALASVTAYL